MSKEDNDLNSYLNISNEEFVEALSGVKVPLLPLDQKWHHLFSGITKNEKIVEYEKKVDDLLKLQGKLNTDIKDLKKVKKNLLSDIVDNMDVKDDNSGRDKKMDENKRLIDEVNERIEDMEDRLLDLPKELDEANKLLMVYSMDACYRVLHENADSIEEIGNWIKKIRIELKKNIIAKQDMESKNEEIYSYMHDVLGPKAIDLFDLKYDDDGEVIDSPDSKTNDRDMET